MQRGATGVMSGERRTVLWPYRVPLLMYGMLSVYLGLVMYLFGVLLVLPRYLLGLNAALLPINEWIVWYSGVPIMVGFALVLGDLLFLFRIKRRYNRVRVDDISNLGLTVALTAYNDEESIGSAVSDFLSHPMVRRVIVVSNNSIDSPASPTSVVIVYPYSPSVGVMDAAPDAVVTGNRVTQEVTGIGILTANVIVTSNHILSAGGTEAGIDLHCFLGNVSNNMLQIRGGSNHDASFGITDVPAGFAKVNHFYNTANLQSSGSCQ